MAGKGRLMPEKIREEALQLVPVERDSYEEDALCETVVETADIVPILLVNQASKTVKMKKGEEEGMVLPLRTLQQVKLNKKERFVKPVKAIENVVLVAPDKFNARVKNLLRANQDMVARSDNELDQTSTVKMRIYTGEHHPN